MLNKQYKNNLVNFNSILILFFPIALVSGPLIPEIFLFIIVFSFIYLANSERKFEYFNKNFIKIFLIFFLIVNISSFYNFYSISIKNSIFYFRFGLFSLAIFFFLSENSKLKYQMFISFSVLFFLLFIDSTIQFFFDKNIFGFEKLIYFISLVMFAYIINFSLMIAKNSTFTENTLYINKNIEGITEDEKKLREKRDLMKYFSLDANEIWHLGRKSEKQQEFYSRIFEDFSTSGRTEDWKNNITFFKKRPIFGYGFQGDRFLTNEPVSNAYIYSLISGGITGFILFTIIAFLSFTKCIKAIFFDKIFYDKSKIILKCSVLINLVVLLRTLIENSFSVYNFDLILFLVTYSIMYLNETNSKKLSQ